MRKLDLPRVLLTSAIFYLALLSGEIIVDYYKVSADEIQSQRIIADTNKSGLAQSNSVCSKVNISVGDLANNLTHRGLISFDLDSLRRDEIGEIASVELDLSGHIIGGAPGGYPFRDLGNLQVVVIDLISYGSDSACRSTYSMAGSIVYDRSGAPLSPINVTDSFKNAYEREARWFYLRLQFSRETDGDNINDYIVFRERISLTVKYSSPPPPVTLESPPNGSIVRSLIPVPVLNWRSIPGVSSYYVQYSQSRDFPSAPTYEAFTNSSQTRDLENGRTYYWRVKRAGTEWRPTDLIWSFTVRVVPDMPWINTPPHGSQISRRKPTLIWNAVSYATSYDLELREGSMSGPEVFHVSPTTTSFVSPHDLPVNKRYVWIIKACNTNRECSGPAMGWFEVVLAAPEPTPSVPKQPPVKLPAPPSLPVKPPVK
jgi:hypothetical protein